MTLMENLLTFQGSWESANEQPQTGLLYCRGQQFLRMTGDSNGAGPVSAMQSQQDARVRRCAQQALQTPLASLMVAAVVRGYQAQPYNQLTKSADDVCFRSQSYKF
jgi:hypothetical protein